MSTVYICNEMKGKDKMIIARVKAEEKAELREVAVLTGLKESEIVRQGTNEKVRKLKRELAAN